MKTHKILFALLISIVFSGTAVAAAPRTAPDLTTPEGRAAADTKHTFNLGPTGLRGWIFRGGTLIDTDDVTGHQPWQILVTSVGAKTPAEGIIAPEDVILGASDGVGGVPVPLFTDDSRKSLARAIGRAEAGDGVLNLKCWRAGATEDRVIRLERLGGYALTAPYDCPKSARILAAAIEVLAKRDTIGNPAEALAMLATGDKAFLPKLQAYARSITPAPGSLNPAKCDTWGWSYKNLFLTEYHLATRDPAALDGVREYTLALAKAQSCFGTYGHGGGETNHAGKYHGSIPPYGPVNQAGLAASLSVLLGKKCGIDDPEVDAAIERSSQFYRTYVQKGTVPYGEHTPWHMHAASNGKNELAAVFYGLQDAWPRETEYYTRLSIAGHEGREVGHTGQGFSYLWGPLGVAIGGPKAAAAYLAEVQWHLDLCRRCDGSFAYDGMGDGVNVVKDYWDASNYHGFIDPTVWHIITFSLPKRQLLITGRDHASANTLGAEAVANAIWAGKYPQIRGGLSTEELLGHFAEFDPIVRRYAAEEFAKRPDAAAMTDRLVGMLDHDDPKVRETACQALGRLKPKTALPALTQRLRDPDSWVRDRAAQALHQFGGDAAPHLADMTKAFIANGSTDSTTIDWSNPLRLDGASLAAGLFTTLGNQMYAQDKELLYPAVRVGLALPTGAGRSSLGGFEKVKGEPTGFLAKLTWEDVQALAPSIVATAAERAPADRMFAAEVWFGALALLGKYRVEEGIPLALRMNDKQVGQPQTFAVLTNSYRGAAKEALPALKVYQDYLPEWEKDFFQKHWWVMMGTEIASTIDAIANDPSPPELNYFKKIESVSATPADLTLPAAKAALACAASDLDQGTLSYTWSKVRGEGDVSFEPNGSPDAAKSTATFAAPGTYVLRVTVVDKTILDPDTWRFSSSIGWRDFKTYDHSMGAVSADVTVKVSPAGPGRGSR